MQADGSQKKTLKSYDYNAIVSWSVDIETRPAEFGEIYIRRYLGENNNQFDEYKNGKVTTSKITIDEYNNETYPSYSVSPSGKRTLWSDYRDGKNVFFVGNSSGEDGKQIGSSEDYSAYGWYTDDYILLTRKGSEMHIMPAEGLTGGVEKSLKISDYYKPNYSNRGFGYGYGG